MPPSSSRICRPANRRPWRRVWTRNPRIRCRCPSRPRPCVESCNRKHSCRASLPRRILPPIRTCRSKLTALSPDGSASPGLLPGQTAAGSSGSMLKSASPSPIGAGTDRRNAGLWDHRPPTWRRCRTESMPPSRPRPEETATEKPDASGSNPRPPGPDPALTRAQAPPAAATVPALPRVEETVRAFDAPGKIRGASFAEFHGAMSLLRPNPSCHRRTAARATPSNRAERWRPCDREPSADPGTDRVLPPPPAPEVKLDPVAKAKYDDFMIEGRAEMQQGRYNQAAQYFLLRLRLQSPGRQGGD